MIIKIPKQIINQCDKFAREVIGTNIDKYRIRKQSQAGLIKNQISQGKIAEYAVYLFFDKRCTEPDFEIYDKKQKSFDADCNLGHLRLHVKSQSKQSEERYGISWVFQAEDPLFKTYNINDMCIFCVVDDDEVEIKLLRKFENLKFNNPKLPKLRGIKKMVYYKDNCCDIL